MNKELTAKNTNKKINVCVSDLLRPYPPPVIPQPWYMENVARLLVLCGSTLCYTFLASKALNGRLGEISRIIIHIILVKKLQSLAELC